MPQAREDKLYLVMVGLPARGKSTIAARIKENLSLSGVNVEIFNNGDLRRKLISGNTSFAEFYDPSNTKGYELREKIARMNISSAREFLNQGGDVAILDATNVSQKRRQLLCDLLSDHPLVFMECINTDREILEASISKKASLPEFGHLTLQDSISSFKQRIAYYEHIYAPFSRERNTMRVDSLNNQILEVKLTDSIPFFDQIRDLIVTDSVKNLYLVRHGETYDNIENRIGGDARLTPKGKEQADHLALHFKDTSLPYIFCSQKMRTIETSEPISHMQQDRSTLVMLKEFNEIDAGICENMSYEEIQSDLPEVYQQRFQDKYNYIYPQGEGYVTMRPRIDRGLKKALFLSGNADHIMIVGHRAVNRMILSHFLYRRIEDVPFIYVPQNQYYHIICTQQKKLFELKPIGLGLG